MKTSAQSRRHSDFLVPLNASRWRLPGPLLCLLLHVILALAATTAVVHAADAPPTLQFAVLTPQPEPPATRPASNTAATRRFPAESCARCHQADAGFSHPVGVVPSFAIPAELPLTDGRITCLTCHDDSVAAHDQARIHSQNLLRTSAEGPAFCANCHTSTARTRAAQHGAAFTLAHLRWAPNDPALRLAAALGVAAPRAPAVADETRTCLGCHDGTVASDVTGRTTDGRRIAAHPVSVPYRFSALGSPDERLVPLFRLDPRLRLFDGQVGCGTCHSPYSREQNLLVMKNDHSKLCLACHAMR